VFLTDTLLLYCKKQARIVIADPPDFKGFFERYLCSLSDTVCCLYYNYSIHVLRGIHGICYKGARTASLFLSWHTMRRYLYRKQRVSACYPLLISINRSFIPQSMYDASIMQRINTVLKFPCKVRPLSSQRAGKIRCRLVSLKG